MTDIVERLREHNNWLTSPDKILNEAADTIATLRAEVAALREGLQAAAARIEGLQGHDVQIPEIRALLDRS